MADVAAERMLRIRVLRDRTGAGMLNCKIALAETRWDVEAAIDWMRRKTPMRSR
jgi:translation elongation factor EF-Ts